MLRVRNLHVYYGRIHALRAATIHVAEREVVALLGGNGSGKTTLLSAISGVVRAATGEVALGGKPITRARPDQIVREGIAHVPEGRHIFKPLTVEDNLLLGAYHRFARVGRAAIHTEAEEVFRLFPVLAERRGQAAGTLSGGEQQMLAIGRALMTQPKLLMLDEPSLGLAPFLVAEIFDIVRRINSQEGVSVLLVEQNAVAALEVVSHGYLMDNGRIVMHASAEAMKRNPDIQQFYLGGAEGRNFHEIKHYSRRKRWLS